MSSALPLPRGFFDTNVRISEDARRRYIEHAEAAIRQVFALADAQRNAWIPVREKKGVAVFRNFSRSATATAHRSNVSEVGGKASLHASLTEVARAYAAHDDALFRRLMKKLNPHVLDAAVLSTIVPRTPQAPFRYIGVKWFAVKTPTPLVAHRDYCCLEVQDRIVDAFGNEMYLRVLSSLTVGECPSLEPSHALVRGQLLAGFLYRADRAEPHVVRVHHVARVDPCGYFPSQWAYKTAEAQLVSSVVQLRRVVEKQQMNACTFVDRREWVPNHARASCAVCSRGFGAFRPRHHCRCCGEVICGKCSVFKRVDVPGTTLRSVRLCAVCNMGVQRAADGAHDDDDDARSDGSAASSRTLAHNEMHMVDLSMLAGTSGPGTPSAYSSASSTASDLSFRSTASSRSVADRRTRGLSAQHAALARTGSQRSGLYASTTPRSFYDAATPRSYIANNLTQGFGAGSSSGDITPRSDTSSVLTPSSAAQRMMSFKQHPLDLGYLRDSIASSSSSSHSTTAAVAAPSSAAAAAAADGTRADCDALELSAASTASALSSSNSAPFAEEKEPVGRGRAMTFQPCVVHECSERESSFAAPRKSAARLRKSDDSSAARRPFFGGLFSRSAATAVPGRGAERSCAQAAS